MNRESLSAFIPEREQETIKSVSQDDKGQKYRTFLRERGQQKETIATLGSILIDTIVANPNVTVDELNSLVDSFSAAGELSVEQRTLLYRLIDEYERRHQQVLSIRQANSDDRELFKYCFGFFPEGPIAVVVGPITLHFMCSSDRDYQKISPDVIDKQGRQFLSKGKFFPSRQLFSVEKGGITMMNARTRIHEETHALKNLFDQAQVSKIDNHYSLKADIEQTASVVSGTKDKGEQEAALKHFARRVINARQEALKNEIFAFLRGDQSTRRIPENLADYRIGGGYDYYSGDQKTALTYFHGHMRAGDYKYCKEILPGILDQQRKVLVKRAIYAINFLRNKKYNTEQIIGFFIDVPLSKWPKEVKRLQAK